MIPVTDHEQTGEASYAMNVGRYRISTHNHGSFLLDGGAMFGVLPKALWSKVYPPDEQNRIQMVTRSLIIEDGDRKMIVDLGCGDKWHPKMREIFGLSSEPYKPVHGVTDVLLTHLHFDHSGGISRYGEDGKSIVANYPDAKHYVSLVNYENGRKPNAREKASYLRENIDILESLDSGFLDDGDEVLPGISVHRSDGHTTGLMWVTVSDGGETIAYPTDLCPTSKHLPITYSLGYDMCAETGMREKHAFLQQAVDGKWLVVFEHDAYLPAARLRFDERGRPAVAETVLI
jgi:glyoxylase-like metal-dependent hydrolase (beta-lactamase superfamily II)